MKLQIYKSLTLSEKEIRTQMFSCKSCEIYYNTIFKELKKLSISTKNAIVDIWPGSKYCYVSSH